MDGSQWIVGGGARASERPQNGTAKASGAEDWLLSNGRAARSAHPAAPPRQKVPRHTEELDPPDAGPTPSDSREDEELAAFYERTSHLQSCVEEMDRRAKRVSRRVSRLASVLPTGPGFAPAPTPEAFVPSKPAQRSSRSKSSAEPIRSIVEGWVPKRN